MLGLPGRRIWNDYERLKNSYPSLIPEFHQHGEAYCFHSHPELSPYFPVSQRYLILVVGLFLLEIRDDTLLTNNHLARPAATWTFILSLLTLPLLAAQLR